MRLMFMYVLGRYAASTVLSVPDFLGGQLRGNKECPFSGVTRSGTVWWKVPESDARGVDTAFTFGYHWTAASRIRLGSEV